MSNVQGRQHVVHQDYIARQRYNNALPPPPGAPKLLEIPTQGLETYAQPTYAAQMARAQPLNIEADAFGGMPLDLVGMPGVFEGDESSIQAPLITPPVHPRDRALLRPLKSLGAPKTEVSGFSFLRRTQYVADDINRRAEAAANRKAPTSTPKQRRKTAEGSKNEPVNILREVVKGFDIANPADAYKGPDTGDKIRGAVPTIAEVEAWKNPVHPTKPHLKMKAAYPLIPDLEALTDEGGYMVTKFTGQPTGITDHHDPRMDGGLLLGIPLPAQIAEYQAKQAAHEADPTRVPAPALAMDYEFFLPVDDATAANVRQKMDVHNPNKDDPKLYTYSTKGNAETDSFRYDHVRDYESGMQTLNEDKYLETAIVLHDFGSKGDSERGGTKARGKVAFYYPITSKVQLKPRRSQFLAQAGLGGKDSEEHGKIDQVVLTIREPSEDEVAKRSAYKATIVPNDEPKV
ncbi:hypothetical protein MMC13_001321 [Lambiella insularis]|nr:hypothetical protein [Lambiella insularis]